MAIYQTWAATVPTEMIQAASSFAARKVLAAKHNIPVHECIARVVQVKWDEVYNIKIRNHTFTAPSLAEISAIYCRERDASGEGASTFPFVNVVCDGRIIGHLSYNGRIWPGKVGTPHNNDSTPLYDFQ